MRPPKRFQSTGLQSSQIQQADMKLGKSYDEDMNEDSGGCDDKRMRVHQDKKRREKGPSWRLYHGQANIT